MKQTTAKIFILLASVLLLFAILILATFYVAEKNVCKAPECNGAAAQIFDHIDITQDPCKDFYNFACGNFLKKNNSSFTVKLKAIIKKQLREIVTAPDNEEENLPHSLKMQRKFYQACIDTAAIDLENNMSFLKILKQTGGWPALKRYAWDDDQFNWVESMMIAKKVGFSFGFFFKVTLGLTRTRYSSVEENYLQIMPPHREEIPKGFEEKHLKSILSIASSFGVPNLGADIELKRTIRFGQQFTKLVGKFWSRFQFVEAIRIKDIRKDFIKMSWLKFLKNITGNDGLREDDKIILQDDDYFRHLYALLLITPKRIIANYVAWYIITREIDYLSSNVREKYAKIQPIIGRNESCYQIALSRFKNVAESRYFMKYSDEDQNERMGRMIEGIQSEIRSVVSKNVWMDEDTKNTVLTHINQTSYFLERNRSLEEITGFSNFYLTSNNFFDMSRELYIHEVKTIFKSSRKINILEQFHYFPPMEINAFYSAKLNHIFLTVPTIHNLLITYPKVEYLNYGLLGMIIAHELTHSFTQMELYANNSKPNLQCFLDDYRQNTKTKSKMDLWVKVDEIIADITGINLAYKAYQNWIENYGPDEDLPGITYSQNQLFWIRSAIFFCNADKDAFKNVLTHAPNPYRVNSWIRNSPYFGDDFDCPIGAEMNPSDKCQVFI